MAVLWHEVAGKTQKIDSKSAYLLAANWTLGVAVAGQNVHNTPLSDIPSLFLGETFGQYSTITQARPSG